MDLLPLAETREPAEKEEEHYDLETGLRLWEM
jgi:hypothetical protein